MTPPDATVAGNTAKAAAQHPAVSVCLEVLQNRSDFLLAAKGRRQATPGFVLQAMRRDEAEVSDTIRIGYTCSKKVGNAVARNRAKRRLREIARLILTNSGKPGWDYVLIGRVDATANRDFTEMKNDLRRALACIHH